MYVLCRKVAGYMYEGWAGIGHMATVPYTSVCSATKLVG